MSIFEVVQGVEGCCLVLDDVRIAGPKPWGGGRVINSWTTGKKYAELGNETCKITATSTNNLMYPDYMTKWYELSCGHSLTLKGDEAPKWCAVCGKAVKR